MGHVDTEFRISAAPAMQGTLVLPQYQLLHSGYDHMGILVDLYGAKDDDGVEVCDIALVGDKRSLGELISAKTLKNMTHFVERRLDAKTNYAAQRQFARQQAIREMAVL